VLLQMDGYATYQELAAVPSRRRLFSERLIQTQPTSQGQRLFIAQRGHGIDTHRATSWYVAGEDR
jgi:hypothetical protein